MPLVIAIRLITLIIEVGKLELCSTILDKGASVSANSDNGRDRTEMSETIIYKIVAIISAEIIAIGTVRFGFLTSSATLDISSKPIKAKNAKNAPRKSPDASFTDGMSSGNRSGIVRRLSAPIIITNIKPIISKMLIVTAKNIDCFIPQIAIPPKISMILIITTEGAISKNSEKYPLKPFANAAVETMAVKVTESPTIMERAFLCKAVSIYLTSLALTGMREDNSAYERAVNAARIPAMMNENGA